MQNLINGLQEVMPLIRNSTWIKGILVIVEIVVRNLINGGARSNATNKKLNLD